MSEWFMTWAKGNYDMISLLVGIIGVVVAIISVISAKRNSKDAIRKKIAEKQAELAALGSIHHGIDHTTASDMMVRSEVLRKEIEELKRQLK